MKLSDLTWGILNLALGLGVLVVASGMEASPYFQYGAGFYPSIIGAMLMLVGLVLSSKGVVAARAGRAPMWLGLCDWCRVPGHWLSLGLVIGGLIAFLLLVEPLGFLPTGWLLVAGLGARFTGRPLRAMVCAVGVVGFLYVFFQQVMGVPLPQGVLANLGGL
ncbi:tripartite tricarboxylate transporter TctB family protein [Pseudomonas sp. MTM4]|uniref:tripartite tricarboxylate transporter TctB family protein n=1 Tax=unclassified Pseudomonas TaxID=196821 RepID=UPI0018D24D0A|nr:MULTISPECIES: tripartite tricarboxylate transporter TctB family protein [unclassified Pseudomonas]MBC8649885.1 tripartite tricarboxylate transporter TctB family protein [Pseudomonas sp. MT4]QXY92227.1 tripartite tricarboxylate transporter TctB family protein [Pseudomonas sp. MTM4]